MINKYYKQVLEKSTDGGVTWIRMNTYQKGALYELEGKDCSPKFRTIYGEYYCDGYIKYQDYYNQVSTDGGDTWVTQTSGTSMIEKNSCDCGYEAPLTFIADERGSFSFSDNVEYSIDAGATWHTLAANTNSPLIDRGFSILWRGNNNNSRGTGVGRFYSSGKFKAEGNPLSLVYGSDNYIGVTSLEGLHNIFNSLFKNSKITDAKNLSLQFTTLDTDCYYGMFSGCEYLTLPPTILPALRLKDYCYASMFYGCTRLTRTPALPATVAAVGCYNEMFMNCKSLSRVPTELPCTNLSSCDYCYAEMFSGCEALLEAPDLPATTLSSGCYQRMFMNCKSLRRAPELMASGTTISCYQQMFQGCASLISAPSVLPSSVVEVNAYDRMFADCVGLMTTPRMNITTVGQYGCFRMFGGCSSIEDSPQLAATTVGKYGYWKMYSGCTAMTSATTELPSSVCNQSAYEGMFEGCTSLRRAPTIMATRIYQQGCKDMFNGCRSLTSCQSALHTTRVDTDACRNMFKECAITQAPNLPASTIGDNCYDSMFYRCTNLQFPPSILPSSSLRYRCYYSMFYGCTSLIGAPMMSAQIMATESCMLMFYGCTSLGEISSLSGVTSLETSCCEGMFQGCTSLTTVNRLVSTTVMASYCFKDMFNGCTSLSEVASDIIPSTNLEYACYYGMFRGCRSLRRGPDLPAQNMQPQCYAFMFNGCTSLDYIACYALQYDPIFTTAWVENVAQEGLFYMNHENREWQYNVSGVPQGWDMREWELP